MKTYTTAQGDMWDKIAYSQLGAVRHTDTLIMANLEHRDVYIFSAGIVLNIPDVKGTEASDSLPPWKRVSG